MDRPRRFRIARPGWAAHHCRRRCSRRGVASAFLSRPIRLSHGRPGGPREKNLAGRSFSFFFRPVVINHRPRPTCDNTNDVVRLFRRRTDRESTSSNRSSVTSANARWIRSKRVCSVYGDEARFLCRVRRVCRFVVGFRGDGFYSLPVTQTVETFPRRIRSVTSERESVTFTNELRPCVQYVLFERVFVSPLRTPRDFITFNRIKHQTSNDPVTTFPTSSTLNPFENPCNTQCQTVLENINTAQKIGCSARVLVQISNRAFYVY